MNPGYAYTLDDLEDAVEENSLPNLCSLTHSGDSDPRHREPAISTLPGDPADWNGIRSLLHLQYPDGTWRTTAVGIET